jgi:hypothetical protein
MTIQPTRQATTQRDHSSAATSSDPCRIGADDSSSVGIAVGGQINRYGVVEL